MAGHIPQYFINELLARSDLVDIIDRRITLKKTGSNYTACCPFHNEKTPSFSVNPDKQFYHCFGCGASGNALTFLMEYEGQEFVAAVEDLATQMGVEVVREAYSKSSQIQQPTNLFALLEKVTEYYQQQLKSHPGATNALNYLKKRGLSDKTIEKYGIGFAPNAWQNLLKLDYQPQNNNITIQKELIEAGMMLEKDNKHAYDRFRGRIMFPIRNRRGQVIGFGGRVIDHGEPKYLNSPETRLFHKGKELYGIYEMRRQLRNIDHILIVEGYMDVIGLAQFQIYNAIATLGTATTSEHLQTLFRLCPKIVFCFDGDQAGKAAALRALRHALPMLKDAREIRLMFLPDGEDPDSLVRKVGTEAFKQRVETATTLFDYLINQLKSQVNMDTFEGPAKLVHFAKPYYQAITDPVLSARFVSHLCTLSGLKEAELNRVLQHKAPSRQAKTTTSSQNSAQENPTTKSINSSKNEALFKPAIGLLLQYPDTASPATDLSWLKSISEPGAQILYQMVELAKNNENITTALLIEHWREKPEEPHLKKLATMELYVDNDNANIIFGDIIKRLEKIYVIEQYEALIHKSKQQLLTQEEKKTLKRLLLSTHN